MISTSAVPLCAAALLFKRPIAIHHLHECPGKRNSPRTRQNEDYATTFTAHQQQELRFLESCC